MVNTAASLKIEMTDLALLAWNWLWPKWKNKQQKKNNTETFKLFLTCSQCVAATVLNVFWMQNVQSSHVSEIKLTGTLHVIAVLVKIFALQAYTTACLAFFSCFIVTVLSNVNSVSYIRLQEGWGEAQSLTKMKVPRNIILNSSFFFFFWLHLHTFYILMRIYYVSPDWRRLACLTHRNKPAA